MFFKSELLDSTDWFVIGEYIKKDDSSVLYSSSGGGFELFLGEGWSLSLDIDYNTGRCFGISSLLNSIKLEKASISLPNTIKIKLFFITGNKLTPGDGSHYIPFLNKYYYDPVNKIICFGDISADGIIYEFAANTFAKLSGTKLKAIYIKLDFNL